MKLTRRTLLWLPLPVLVILFLLAGVAADAWLETSGGRALLQSELSKSLGLPVRLEGVYHFKFIPRLKIAGTDLRVGMPHGEATLASSKNYSATVELLPFIRGEMRIASIELSGGFVDFNQPPAGSAAEAQESLPNSTLGTLPQVASLEISDFFIHIGQEGTGVLLEQLQLSGFQPGRASGLTMTAAFLQTGIKSVEMSLQGELTVNAGDLSSSMLIKDLQADWSGLSFAGLTGLWEWHKAVSQLTGDMTWKDGVHSVDMSLILDVGEPVAGKLTGHYGRSGLPEPLELGTRFSFSPDQIELTQVYLDQSGQSIRGAGCVLLAEPASVQLTLASDELDLDRLREVLPGKTGGDAGLPVDLALVLRVNTARLGGAVASDVVVEIGSTPVSCHTSYDAFRAPHT